MLIFVKFIKPACSGKVITQAGKEVPMRCHYASVCLIYIAILLILVNVVVFFTEHFLTASIVDLALAVLTFLSTNTKLGMGICADLTMSCHSMASAAKFIAIIVGVLAVILLFKKEKSK